MRVLEEGEGLVRGYAFSKTRFISAYCDWHTRPGIALRVCTLVLSLLVMLTAVDSSLGGRRDFPRMAQEITIPAAANIREDFTASIPITNDNINEALEGFLLLVETSEDTSTNTEAPIIVYRNDGLTIGLIVDDDGQSTPHVCSHACSLLVLTSNTSYNSIGNHLFLHNLVNI